MAGKVGILLVNLGSPDTASPGDIRRYLKEFLSDPRVVELPRLLWQPILRLLVLPRRPQASAKLYQRIWDREEDDNPLRVISRAQVRRLSERLPDDIPVAYGLRYGKPSLESALDSLLDKGVERLLIAPLYPQYCSATTGTALQAVWAHLGRKRHVPAVRTLPPYYDDSAYIGALAATVREKLTEISFVPDRILLSFHGIPAVSVQRGDPYLAHCEATANGLRAAMESDADRMPMAFQSRFGRAEWLRPYTEDLLKTFPRQGVRKLLVVCPGFAADCIETIDEIAIRGRETFLAAGGEELALVPALNAGESGMNMLHMLIRHALAGWADLS